MPQAGSELLGLNLGPPSSWATLSLPSFLPSTLTTACASAPAGAASLRGNPHETSPLPNSSGGLYLVASKASRDPGWGHWMLGVYG